MNKLAHHIITVTPAVRGMLRYAPGAGVKLFTPAALDVGMLEEYAARNPTALISYRAWFQYPSLADPVGDAKQIIAEVAPIRHLRPIVEGQNEVWQRREKGELRRYAAYCVQQSPVFHDAGLPFAVGSFSTENPQIEDLELFHDAFAAADYHAWHEYGNVNNKGGLLRYREVLAALPQELHRPILITEYGPVDDGRKGGWRKYMSVDDCATHMLLYAKEVARDPLVKAVFTFTASCYEEDGQGDWVSFRYAGERRIEDVFKESIVSEEKPPYITPREEIPMSEDLSQYATWSLERIKNGEDPRDIAAFQEHLTAVEKDPTSLAQYGVPLGYGDSGYVTAAVVKMAQDIFGHAEAIRAAVAPFAGAQG